MGVHLASFDTFSFPPRGISEGHIEPYSALNLVDKGCGSESEVVDQIGGFKGDGDIEVGFVVMAGDIAFDTLGVQGGFSRFFHSEFEPLRAGVR